MGTLPPAFHREYLTPYVTGYGHEIKRIGGFWSAEFGLTIRRDEVDEWVQDALGAQIVVRNEFANVVWEGFINALRVNIGGYSFQIGPVTEIANKIKIKYTTTRYDIVGIGGEDAETAYADDTDSQARYGTLPLIYSGGEGDSAEMDQLRDALLDEMAWPRPSDQALNVGENSGQAGLTVQCAGYAQLLARYYYSDTSGTSQVDVSDKIFAVIAAHPDSLYSADHSRITRNTLQVYETEEAANEQTAADILNRAVSLGDASLNQYGLGIYEGRRPIYEVEPSTVTLDWRLMTDPGRIYRLGVDWPMSEIRPNEWIIVSDLMGGHAPRALGRDPRIMYVEGVSYRFPRQLQLSGSRVSTIAQRIAQIGNKGF